MTTWVPRAVVALAALAALLASRRDPRCSSIGAGLLASALLDSARVLLPLPYEVALALYLVPLAVGTWLTLHVLAPRLAGAAPLVSSAYCAALLVVPRASQPVVVLSCSVVSELLAAARFLRAGRPRRPSERAVLVLVAGDAVALLGPAGPLPWPRSWSSSRWLVAAQASIVALGVVLALWSDRTCTNSRNVRKMYL